MQKHVANYPLDARAHLQLSYAYRVVGDGTAAIKEIESAILLSPKKIGFYIEKGTVEWDMGDMKSAQKDFNNAYALGPQFSDLAIYSAAGNFAAGDNAESDKILTKVFGTTVVDSDILAVAYYRAKNWPRLISMLKLRTEKPNAAASAWFSLAAAYYMAGDKASAIKSINTAIAKYPDSAAAGASAIKQIQEGK
jgi:tetratricopeptide (TPR) repeat protein